MKFLPIVSLLAVLSITAATAQEPVAIAKKDKEAKAAGKKAGTVTTQSGLQYQDTVVGSGASPRQGQTVVVHYTGWLQSNGQKFDSSVDRGEPFTFPLGQGRVIKGWDEGVATMKVGGKRKLTIPANLAYGPNGHPPQIPGGATLVFDVQLLGLQ